ncbi:major facilitator superfamily domain-containing protein 3-like [Dendronephthya gigantea]|uniref:major facilitator superfamily domain-containing protein 3-like n=1 Tax=Dendronephthya gigantea TaxID=151771 RepID=UPI00106AF1D6|nr:major facilitator superfamily domain-containing protein 3-like [Dendronephthya gigantea]
MRLVLLLWLLYFLQGVPYGFQTKFLPVFLRSYSLSLTLISLTRLLSLPWLLKPLWAPFVDNYGSVISWIKYNLVGMALCYLVASCIPMNSVMSIVTVMALLNIMAATEDIAVDSLFVNHFTPDRIGMGNIAQVVGYKTGTLLGGGLLGWLSSFCPWEQLFFFLSVIYMISAFFICSSFFINLTQFEGKQAKSTAKITTEHEEKMIETHNNMWKTSTLCVDQMKDKDCKTEKIRAVKRRQNFQIMETDEQEKSATTKNFHFSYLSLQKSRNYVRKTLETYVKVYQNVLNSDGTKWTIVYVLIYKLGEQGIISIVPMFLLDNGVSSSNTAMITGVLCQFCSIFGSLIGGMLFSNWESLHSTLAVISSIRFVAIFVLTWLGSLNSININWIWFILFDCLLHLVSGMVTTLTFTLMVACSQKCPKIFSATHYSTLATFEVLGKLCMVSISGIVVDLIGYINFFTVCTCLAVFPIVLLGTGSKYKTEKLILNED